MKKKAEYSTMQEDFEKVNQENNELKNQVRKNYILSIQVNQITMMLYQKIEENAMLTNKLEQ